MEKRNSLEKLVKHDCQVHHPLGGGSYTFQEDYVEYLMNNIHKDEIKISIGAQPNSSPHFGTLTIFNLAFALGNRINAKSNKKPSVLFDVIDTAPSKTVEIDNVKYQFSLRESEIADTHLDEYYELMDLLSGYSNIGYSVRKQEKFNSQKNITSILKTIVDKRDVLSPILDPEKSLLRIRVACPDCGLTDKEGVNNEYFEDFMKSFCPKHGWFETSFEDEPHKFEYNTPLRNLIRAISYSQTNEQQDIPYEYLRITGSDYAGYYQEQLLYKAASMIGYPAHKLPTILYAPLILDWSGAKLSKPLYVKEDAYRYLPKYLLNYKEFKEELGGKGFKKMYDEISNWLDEPYKLFRHYTVYYFMELFEDER